MKILKILKSNPMTWYNIWTWPAELIDDIRQWMIVRSALNEPEIIDKFKKFKYQLRVDNIGRIYMYGYPSTTSECMSYTYTVQKILDDDNIVPVIYSIFLRID